MQPPKNEYTTLMARVKFSNSGRKTVPGWPHIGTLQH